MITDQRIQISGKLKGKTNNCGYMQVFLLRTAGLRLNSCCDAPFIVPFATQLTLIILL